MTAMTYLRPVGLLYGDAARIALANNNALPLSNTGVAFTSVDLFRGSRRDKARVFVSAPDIAASSDSSISKAIERLTAPRPDYATLSLDRPRLMGIVNVTPDSFSDGGEFAAADTAIRHGRLLAAEGADIVDVGGESTRPGAREISEQEELDRVTGVVAALVESGALVSIDTRRANVMAKAVKAGASIINDVTAFTFDTASAGVAAQTGAPVVLMHIRGRPETMQDEPDYDDVVVEVFEYLAGRIDAAVAAGIDRNKIVADPGIGFGKTFEHNLELLQNMSVFHQLGVPIMAGASRKGFIGAVTGVSDAGKRVSGSIGAALAAAMQGVQFLRIHDVTETRQALEVWRKSSGMS